MQFTSDMAPVILWHQCHTVVCKERELRSILLVKQCSQENTIGLRIVHLSSTVHAALECSMGILVLAITLPMMTASRRVQVIDLHSGSNIPKKAAGLKRAFLLVKSRVQMEVQPFCTLSSCTCGSSTRL